MGLYLKFFKELGTLANTSRSLQKGDQRHERNWEVSITITSAKDLLEQTIPQQRTNTGA